MLDTTLFTDKASKNPEERALYEGAADYLTAYSQHTDLRVRRDGPALAIGGQWEEHGPLQLEFLRSRGLTPSSRLLDLGCGTGRFTRHAVPYLDPGHYTGIDISPAALAHARELGEREGWGARQPELLLGDGTLACVAGRRFDLVWAHSVFTHLPPDLIRRVLSDLAGLQFTEFCFTYKRRPRALRTGLKQFGYPPEHFIAAAAEVGLHAEELPDRWPQGQSAMRVRWAPVISVQPRR